MLTAFNTIEIGTFVHAVEGEMLCASTMPSKVCSSSLKLDYATDKIDQVPYFNAPIYLPTKASIGKVDEILGPINEVRLIPSLFQSVIF